MKKILLIALVLALFLYGAITTQAASVSVNWLYDTVTDTLQPIKNAVNARIMGSFFTGTSTTESSTFAILNEVRYADNFPGADFGAKVNTIYAAATSSVKVVVTSSSTFPTPIVANTPGKHLMIECLPGVVLNYTGTGTTTTFASFVYPDYPTEAGMRGCKIKGPGGSSVVAIGMGGSTGGAAGMVIEKNVIENFGTSLSMGQNTYLATVQDNTFQNNNRHLYVAPANNSGENLRFINNLFSDCKTIANCIYFATSSAASVVWEGNSLDNAQLSVASGNFNFNVDGGHCENPAAAGAVIGKYACIVSNAETMSINGLSIVNMATSSAQTPDAFIVNTGYLSINNVSAWSSAGVSAPALVSNGGGGTLNVFGCNEISTAFDTVATSSIGFFNCDNTNVGIGTSSPAGLFDVNGSAFFGNQTGTAQLTLRAGSGRNATIAQEGTSATSAIAINSNGAIDFRTDGISGMYMTDQRLVGIGTLFPQTLFQVAGTSTLATTTVTDLTISRGLRDTSASLGTSGMVLQTTGTSSRWVATSTLGISGGGGSTAWGSITGTLSSQTDLQTALDSKLSTTTGDWLGTLQGSTLATILSRANHTGTQLAATISDFVSTVRSSISESITGLTYNSGTGDLSLDSGYVISTTTRETNQDTAFSWGNHASSSYLTAIATTSVRGMLSSSATGLTYNSATGDFSLTAGSVIPLTASTTAWEAFYQTPSTRITAGTGLSWSGNTLNASGGGTGDVVGPASATDNAIARFDTTTGKLIQNSSATISDTGSIVTGNATGNQSITISSGSGRNGVITQVGSAANSPLQLTSNGALDLLVDSISRLSIGEFGDISLLATTTMPTTTISRLTVGSGTGLLKSTSGLVSTATAGTDYVANVTGDWTGTLDGQEGSYYLNLNNHSGSLSSTSITGLGSLAGLSSVDISSHTNLTGDSEIVLTGDALSIASSIARDSELHSPVTVSGTPDYLTLAGQDLVRGLIDLATDITGTLTDDNGGTGQSTYATGDMLYASGANTLAKRAIGSTGNVLSVVGGVPTWVATGTLGIAGGGGGSSLFTDAGATTYLTATTDYLAIGTTTALTPLYVENSAPAGYVSAAVRNSANDGRAQLTVSAGSDQDYFEGFFGISGSTAANWQNTIEMGCGSAGCGVNLWSDGDFRWRMATGGNIGHGTTSDLNARMAIQATSVGESLIKLFNSVGAAVVDFKDTLATFFTNAWFKGDVVVDGTLDFDLPFRKYVEFFDDYLTETTTAGDAPWLESVTGTGAACTNAAIAVGNRPGMTNCTTGTTATGRTGLMNGLTSTALGQGTTTYKTAVSVTTLSTVTERYSLRVGFQDTTAAAQVDAVYMLYDEGGVSTGSTASANWQCVTASNSTRTYTDTGTAVSAAGWDNIEIIVNAAGNSVDFYIDGVLECTHTTNIPTGTTRALGHGVQALKSIGTTARTFSYDYQYARHEFTTAR